MLEILTRTQLPVEPTAAEDIAREYEIGELDNRIVSLENLGSFAGAFDSFAAGPGTTVPTNVNDAAFSAPPQVNDFINVRADETQTPPGRTTQYIITAIAPGPTPPAGTISWTFNLFLSSDITGKMDLVTPAPATGNLATFAVSGQVQDGGTIAAATANKMNLVTPAPPLGNLAQFAANGQVAAGTGTALASGADLNTVTETGFYGCSTYALSQTMANTPIVGAFSLVVARMDVTGPSRIQHVTVLVSGTPSVRHFMRNGTAGGAWGAWAELGSRDWVTGGFLGVASTYSGIGAQRWIKLATITTQTTTDSVTWNAQIQTNTRTWPTGSGLFWLGVHTRSTTGASYTVTARAKYFATSAALLDANGLQTFFYTRDGETLGSTVSVWCRSTAAGWTDLRVARIDHTANPALFPDGTGWLTAAPAGAIQIDADPLPLVLPPDPVTALRPGAGVVNWADANHQWGGGYVLQGHMVDCRFEADGITPVDPDMYYPIVFHLDVTNSRTNVRIELRSVLMYANLSPERPYWATHGRGFTHMMIWETQGEGWGATAVRRRVLVNGGSRFIAANPATHPTNPGVTQDAVMQITQNTLNSAEVIYVRGGGQYHFAVSHGQRPVFYPAGYSWVSGTSSYNAPPRPWEYFTQAMRDSLRPTNLQVGEAASRTIDGVVHGELTGTYPYPTLSGHIVRRYDRQIVYTGPNTNQWGVALFTLPVSMVSGLSINIEIVQSGSFWGNQQRGLATTSIQITGSTAAVGVNGTTLALNASWFEIDQIHYVLDDSAPPNATVTFYSRRLGGNTNRFDGNVRIRNYTGLNTAVPITWLSANQAAAPVGAQPIPKLAIPILDPTLNINATVLTDVTAPTSFVPRMEQIAGSTDLNHVVVPGFYGVPTNAIAGTIVNRAASTAFSMVVASMSALSDTGRMITQTVLHHTATSSVAMYVRRVSLSGGVGTSATPWLQVPLLEPPPATGTFNLRATNGALSWAAA